MSKKSLFKLFLLPLSIAFLISACGHGNGMPPTMVEAYKAKAENWQTEVNAIGTLAASQEVVIKPEMSGRITSVYFRSGDYVKLGTPIIQLNDDIYKAELKMAEAALVLSTANYNRSQELFQKKVFAKADFDKAASAYQQDEANVAKAKAQLDQTIIKAPFEGRLGLRMVNLGDYVTAGQTVITNLDAIDPLRVDFKVPEIYTGKLAIGQTVVIHSDAFPKQKFEGKVYAVDSKIDPDTRSLSVRATLRNPNKALIPGSFIEVNLQLGKPELLLTIPETAIVNDEKGTFVYRIIKNTAVKTPVKIAMRRAGEVGIASGLKKDESVISVGAFKVMDGAPVMAMPGK